MIQNLAGVIQGLDPASGPAQFAFDSPQPLFTSPPMNGTLGTMAFRYAVTAEGKRFLVLEDSGNATPAPITVDQLAGGAEEVRPKPRG